MKKRFLLLLLVALPAGASSPPSWETGSWAADSWAEGSWLEDSVELTEVPNVRGGSLAAADTALEGVGLDTGAQQFRCSTEAENTVLQQSPAAGTLVAPASTVDLLASNGEVCPKTGQRKLRFGFF